MRGDKRHALAHLEFVHVGPAHVAMLFVDAYDREVTAIRSHTGNILRCAIGRKCFGTGVDQRQSRLGFVHHGGQHLCRHVIPAHHPGRAREGQVAKHISSRTHGLHASVGLGGDQMRGDAASRPDR